MDKDTKELIDLQLECLKTCSGVKQARIDLIFIKYRGLDIYYQLIEYELELLGSESKTIMENNLDGYHNTLKNFKRELRDNNKAEFLNLFGQEK